jgi:hypothetical protein
MSKNTTGSLKNGKRKFLRIKKKKISGIFIWEIQRKIAAADPKFNLK